MEASTSAAAVPNVAPPISLEVNRVAQIRIRHELRLAHRPGVGAHHAARHHVAMVQDFQRAHQLAAKEGGPAPLPRQRRQRLDHVVVAGIGAEIALQAPNARDGLRRPRWYRWDTRANRSRLAA